MKNTIWKLFILTVTALLAACGGGGGGGGPTGPVVSTNAFNIDAGLKNLVANGQITNLKVSGDCSGTASLSRGPANTGATFEGVLGFSATDVITINLSNCIPASSTDTTTSYYDINYVPLGFSVFGGDYGVWASTPNIPVSVHVGDTGVAGTINLFADSTKTISTGTENNSYVVEADTATTAIVNLISQNFDNSNVLQSTEQDRYRIAANGSLTLISVDIQIATSGIHVVMN